MAQPVKFSAEPSRAQKLLAKLREERGTGGGRGRSGGGNKRRGGKAHGGTPGGS
jgi:hypothetical protein